MKGRMKVPTRDLTQRQRDIKAMLDKSLSAQDIADELDISRNAVYAQLEAMKKKGVLPRDYTPSGQPPRAARSTPAVAPGDGTLIAQLAGVMRAHADELERMAAEIRAMLG